MKELLNIKLSDIIIPKKRQWKLSEDNILDLMHSIERVGKIQPPLVRPSDEGYILVTGNHRLEAMKRLGYTETEVICEDITEDMAVLREIDENLVRRVMTFLEEGKQLETRKDIYDKKHKYWFRDKFFKESLIKIDTVIKNFHGRKEVRCNLDIPYLLDTAISKEEVQKYFDNNDLDSLFGHYDDMKPRYINKENMKKLVEIREYFNIELPEVEEYKFFDEVKQLTGKGEKNIKEHISITKKFTAEQVEKLKNIGSSTLLRTINSISDDKAKDELIDFTSEIASKSDVKETKGLGQLLNKTISKITKEEPTIAEKDLVDKVKEEVTKNIELNIENKDKVFSTNQTKVIDFEKNIKELAEIFNVEKTKVYLNVCEDDINIRILLK